MDARVFLSVLLFSSSCSLSKDSRVKAHCVVSKAYWRLTLICIFTLSHRPAIKKPTAKKGKKRRTLQPMYQSVSSMSNNLLPIMCYIRHWLPQHPNTLWDQSCPNLERAKGDPHLERLAPHQQQHASLKQRWKLHHLVRWRPLALFFTSSLQWSKWSWRKEIQSIITTTHSLFLFFSGEKTGVLKEGSNKWVAHNRHSSRENAGYLFDLSVWILYAASVMLMSILALQIQMQLLTMTLHSEMTQMTSSMNLRQRRTLSSLFFPTWMLPYMKTIISMSVKIFVLILNYALSLNPLGKNQGGVQR